MTSYADLNETSSSLGAVLGLVLVCAKCFTDCGPLSTGPMLASKRWSFGPAGNVIIFISFVTVCSQRWSFGPVEQIVTCYRAWLY